MLFFEDEIRKVMDKADSSVLKEMRAQDPRVNGQLRKSNRQASWGFNTSKDNYRT